jgi:hypothetical protein
VFGSYLFTLYVKSILPSSVKKDTSFAFLKTGLVSCSTAKGHEGERERERGRERAGEIYGFVPQRAGLE